MEPAEWEGATGAVAPVANFSVCKADTEILCGALLRGPLQCPCHWHGHCRGPQGPHDTPYRHPVPGGQDGGMGCQNPHGGAASCATMADSHGQRKVGGTPPAFRFWPRLYRRGQNARRSTASLLAVLPPTSAMAVPTAYFDRALARSFLNLC
ncbi:hypothetical protein NDU88_001065 [Pleurodeles waltl]|uniref:Uncharacterized protein n=1 Tax=Pleurodeles waltl TaxID=8319 RepID=A0AAV7M734_PLEWA|nr:hypothetical protein NDU88_001065 [Pleurodeles waltl]